MKNIEIKKFVILVLSIVVVFCVIAGIIVVRFMAPKPPVENQNSNTLYNGETNTGKLDNSQTKDDTQTQGQDTNEAVKNESIGAINIKNINALVKIEKYSMLTNGEFDSKKVNRFIDNNKDRFIPINCTKIAFKADDLDNDGINELGIIYEMSKGERRYLMSSTLRWKTDGFIKDVDVMLKENDYNFDTNEIIAGDIIPGGSSEFIFIQKDPEGLKVATAKIMVLLPKGFVDYYTIVSPYEIEVQDFDNDGSKELYTSAIGSDGMVHKSWKKWNDSDFQEYDSRVDSLISDSSTLE